MRYHTVSGAVGLAAALIAASIPARLAAKSIVTRGNSQEAQPQQGQYPNQYPQQPQGQPNILQADPTRNMTPEQRARWCREHPGYC